MFDNMGGGIFVCPRNHCRPNLSLISPNSFTFRFFLPASCTKLCVIILNTKNNGMQNDLLPGKKIPGTPVTKNGNRILFACVPADGHFAPLTGLATYLKSIGYDVRWYTQNLYEDKINKLGIPYYPFVKVPQLNQLNFEEVFPERSKLNKQVDKFKFDFENVFIRFGYKYYEDIQNIHQEFPFDLMIADVMFTGTPYVKDKLQVPVIGMGIIPVMESSRDLPPGGLGLEPASSFLGKVKQNIMRFIADNMVFSGLTKLNNNFFQEHGVKKVAGNAFDIMYRKPSLVLQSGTPGFEYQRTDLNPKIRFIGPLLPKRKIETPVFKYTLENARYGKIILATQGTVEKDVEKLLVPLMEAFKDTDNLLIVTTGGSRTEELRKRFPQKNIIVEDFIPFDEVMPVADVYVTNGGYGGVMLGISHNLPLVVAGVHEGKNEICARVGYFKLGVNLKTEKPSPRQLKTAVEKVLNQPVYRNNVNRLSDEFAAYSPDELCAMYVKDLLDQAKEACRKKMKQSRYESVNN